MCLKNGHVHSRQIGSEPVLDMEYALGNLADDMDLYREAVGYFFESAPKLIDDIAFGCKQSQKDVKRNAHSLKSASRTIGAMRLGALAQCIESENDHIALIQECSIHLYVELDMLREALIDEGLL